MVRTLLGSGLWWSRSAVDLVDTECKGWQPDGRNAISPYRMYLYKSKSYCNVDECRRPTVSITVHTYSDPGCNYYKSNSSSFSLILVRVIPYWSDHNYVQICIPTPTPTTTYCTSTVPPSNRLLSHQPGPNLCRQYTDVADNCSWSSGLCINWCYC